MVELEVEGLPNELTQANNRAAVPIEGIREKLRVLLVSGEPHAGERTWRNLLKSDANVDLVHFTILRPSGEAGRHADQRAVADRLPDAELFQQKIKDFDLIIFDRYANQSVLPSSYFENIVRYVRDGGAVLVAAGPEFASYGSLAQTRLAPIIPGTPDGRIVEEALQGRHHPDRRAPPGDARSPGLGRSHQPGANGSDHRLPGPVRRDGHVGRQRPAAPVLRREERAGSPCSSPTMPGSGRAAMTAGRISICCAASRTGS